MPRQGLPRHDPGKALRESQDPPSVVHYHRDLWHDHPGGDTRHGHTADSTVGMVGKGDWHLGPLDPAAARVAALDDTTEQLAARPPTGDDADPPPATSFSPSEAATPDDAVGTASEPALTGGSGGAAGAGRPIQLERPGQVAAGFGTSSGDVPFQAALMSVLRPAADDAEARVLAEEMAHLAGLMRTAGQVAADYHAHGRLAAPGLLVGLRFQIDAMLTPRGLQP